MQQFQITVGTASTTVTANDFDTIDRAVRQLRALGADGQVQVKELQRTEEQNAQELDIQNQILDGRGFAGPSKLFHNRAGMAADSEQAATRQRRAFERLETIEDATRDIERKVMEEERMVFSSTTKQVALLPDGALWTRNGETERTWEIEHRAFDQLCKRVGVPTGGQYLSALPPAMRTRDFDYWVSQQEGPKGIQLRTRLSRHRRVIFAALGSGFSTEADADVLARMFRHAFAGSGGRAEYTYDGHRMSLDVTFQTTRAPKDAYEGEIFQAGIRCRTGDSGNAGISFEPFVRQNVCNNCVIVHTRMGKRNSIAHTNRDIVKKAKDAMSAAIGSIDLFLSQWNVATTSIIDADNIEMVDDRQERPETITELLRGTFYGLRGQAPIRKADLDGLLFAHEFANDSSKRHAPVTRASVANALTRYAHAGQSDPQREHELEAVAGRIVAGAVPLRWRAA